MVGKLRVQGLPAERVPLSGSAGGRFAGDLICVIGGHTLRGEVKARAQAKGWQTIKDWIKEADLLFLVEDHHKPLVVLPWETWELLAGGRTDGDATTASTPQCDQPAEPVRDDGGAAGDRAPGGAG